MTLETLMTNAQDAGFIVDARYPFVIISLKNRRVTCTEVALALNIEESFCRRDGASVLIEMA